MKPWRSVRGFAVVAVATCLSTGGCIPDGSSSTTFEASPPPSSPGIGGRIGARPSPPSSSLGPLQIAAVRPPAVSGGTLIVLRDGTTAVAADPERDLIAVVDLVTERLLASIPLLPGDEPGRLIERSSGDVLVALRRGGAIVRVDVGQAIVAQRVPVCGAPRGIAFDRTSDAVFVACAGGEVVSLGGSDLVEKSRVRIDADLRDVVVSGNHLFVTRFRAAEVLTLVASDLSVIARRSPPGSVSANQRLVDAMGGPSDLRVADPAVAWRMRLAPDGAVRVLHQEASNGELSLEAGGYGGDCRPPITTSMAQFQGAATPGRNGPSLSLLLPYDFDMSADGKRIAVVAADDLFGAQSGSVDGGARVALMATETMDLGDKGGCGAGTQPLPEDEVIALRQPTGEATSVAFDGQGRVVVQTREPARIEIVSHRGGTIKISDDGRADTGHRIFHAPTSVGLACASCHPEGGDDGRVWRFQKLGTRRTQNLLGGINLTAPFHWDGDMRDFRHLMSEVFTGRMRGALLTDEQSQALQGWVDHLPAVKPSGAVDPAAAERGRGLFADAKVACVSCHTGALLTDNTNRVVGTGAMLQVPGLRGVALRAPYMHDGCAKTLMDRFTQPCGGGDLHGVTSHLTKAQLGDLVVYLETL